MRSSGFTLIELLLVLAIIGIISAIAIPALLGQRENARNKATLANAAHIKAVVISALGELDKPIDQRSADLATAKSVTDVLTALPLRSEFNIAKPDGARNPYNRNLAAYRFNSLAPTVAGEVNLSAPVTNKDTGEQEIIVGYGIMKKGTVDLTPRITAIDASH